MKSFGCWRDTSNRAIPTVEGSSSLLDGAYKSRSNALQKCARVALERGYKIFAVQVKYLIESCDLHNKDKLGLYFEFALKFAEFTIVNMQKYITENV